MAIKFSNNASTVISSDITATDTSIPVTDASVFPALGAGEHTYVTLENTNGDLEIVKVTAISSNTLTVIRGQDGTTARAYSSGDFIQLRVTAALLNDLSQEAATTEWADILNKPDSVITLSGDVSGSGTMTDLGSVTITTSVSGYNNTNWDTAYSWGDHGAAGYLTSFTEADPVFSASAAAAITGTKITNWDTAYSWGDHASAGYLTSFTETDPVFSASAAAGISATNITNWDTAYGWGNHASAGYLTSFTETDPVFSASAASGITSTNITNWNTAYGWGDHASAGYLTGNQTITLSGDASGSGTTSIVVTVADDSHNHIISNVDGLQTALNAKLDATAAAVSAAKWTTARTVSLTGAVTGSASVDGSANVSIATTATSDPTITLTGAVTGSGTMTNLGNVSIATTATADPTLTLSGDASGSATFTNLGNATLSVTVANDSHTHAFNNLTSKTSGTGTYTTSGDFRAPIFYDSGNTAYYTDAAATSVMNTVYFGSGQTRLMTGSNNRNLQMRTGATSSGAGIVFTNSSGTFQGQLYAAGTSYGFLASDWGSWDLRKDNAGNLYLNNQSSYYVGTDTVYMSRVYGITDVRAAVFYDNNDTNKYVDPTGATVLNYLRLDSTAAYQLYTNNTYLNIRYGTGSGGGIGLYDSGDVLQGYWFGNGSGEHGFLDNDGDWAVRIRTGTNPNIFYCNGNAELYVYTSYVRAIGSFRAPIFYDNDNTAYYFDGSSTGDSIRVAGDIVAYYSDERLKTNLGNIESPVDKVKQLNGFKYHANELGAKHGYDPEKIQVGVSAQEVEAVLPEVVRDAPIGHGYKTVQYERLVPLLIEAIKEQAGQIEALQSEVAKLKG